MGIGSVIGGALSLGGAVLGSSAAKSAANQQADAANRATDSQLQMFNTQNSQQAPYRQAGYSALNALGFGLGLPGYSGGSIAGKNTSNLVIDNNGVPTANPQFYGIDPVYTKAWDELAAGNRLNGQTVAYGNAPGTTAGVTQALKNYLPDTAPDQSQSGGLTLGQFNHSFNADDLKTNLAPNYQFMLDQGLGATKNASNLTNGFAGNTLKGLNDYAQNYASNGYQQAFNNYTANQTNIFNRLSNIAGLGQTANSSTSQLAGSLSPSIANTIVGAGSAQAAGTVGSANALSGGANNAMGWYTLSNLGKSAGGGGSGGGSAVTGVD